MCRRLSPSPVPGDVWLATLCPPRAGPPLVREECAVLRVEDGCARAQPINAPSMHGEIRLCLPDWRRAEFVCHDKERWLAIVRSTRQYRDAEWPGAAGLPCAS